MDLLDLEHDIWLKGELNYLISEHLSKEKVESAGFVNYKYVNNVVSRFLSGEQWLYLREWNLVILHKWYFSSSNLSNEN